MCQDLCEGLIALQPSLTSYSALPVASQLSICRVTTSKSYELNHHHDFLLTIMGSRLKDGPYWDTVDLKPKGKSDGRTMQCCWSFCSEIVHIISAHVSLVSTGVIAKPDVDGMGMCKPLSGSGSQKLRRIIQLATLHLSLTVFLWRTGSSFFWANSQN